MESDVQQFIIDYLQTEHNVVAAPQDSIALKGIDSVTLAQLTFALEKKYEFRVDEDVLDVDTIEELAEYVVQRLPLS